MQYKVDHHSFKDVLVGRELFASCTPFREAILMLDDVYASIVGTSLVQYTRLFIDDHAEPQDTLGEQWPSTVMLPALTMLQLALVDTLAAVGVTPDIVIGHSAGETPVLSVSGCGSKEMAMALSIARGRAVAQAEHSQGTMAAVSCTPAEAHKIIDEVHTELGQGVLTIGCYNTPNAVTLSGAEAHIDAAVAKATARGIFARRLRTRVPVHSALMEPCRSEFVSGVEAVFAQHTVTSSAIKVYSSTTGRELSTSFDAQYYWNGTVGPVLFSDALSALVTTHPGATFVEIGPHPVLSGYLRDHSPSSTIVCPLRRPRAPQTCVEVREFLGALGQLIAAGHTCVDFDALYGGIASVGAERVKTPAYPFARKVVPWAVDSAVLARQRQHRNGPMNYPQLAINTRTHPGLADHVIKGEPIMPAAGFIEMVSSFGLS